MIPTPHLSAKKGEIAEMVLIFGDPVRCRRSAEKHLENVKEVSSVRGNLYFTGTYKGKEVTFGTSGMGLGSIGIYSYELFSFYGVKKLIRVGTSGAYSTKLEIGSKILVSEAVTDFPYFAEANYGQDLRELLPDQDLFNELRDAGKKIGVKLHECRVHSTDVFYAKENLEQLIARTGADCVEMEAYALFVQAKRTGGKACCLLSITDTLFGSEKRLTPEERVLACDPLIETALNIL